MVGDAAGIRLGKRQGQGFRSGNQNNNSTLYSYPSLKVTWYFHMFVRGMEVGELFYREEWRAWLTPGR